jgi:hypothetical protein
VGGSPLFVALKKVWEFAAPLNPGVCPTGTGTTGKNKQQRGQNAGFFAP